MKFIGKLKSYQRGGTDFALLKKFSLNGDEMGLGKTAEALALACEAGSKRTLVVCPSFLIFNWIAEIEKFTGEKAETKFKKDAPIYVSSYGSLSKVSRRDFDCIIGDEIHYVKNMNASRSKKFHNLLQKCPLKYFIGLSGTPIKNRVPEFYSLLLLCWYGGFYPEFGKYAKSYWAFCLRFTNQQQLNFGGKKVTKFEGLRNVAELKALIAPVYIRRKADEVLDLPPEVERDLLMTEKSEVDDLLEQAWENYNGNKKDKTFASGKAVSALAKTKYTIEFVRSTIDEASSFIIYTDHVQSAKELYSHFGSEEARLVIGATTMPDRAQFVEDLNAGKYKILVATIGSLSVGVNLTGCNHMIFNDFPWVPADLAQAKKRIHRIGQEKTCFYYYVFASKFDQLIFKTLQKKRAIIEKVGV